MNWLIEEANKCNSEKDRIILENPQTLSELDDSLIKNYYPYIKSKLRKTGFNYYPLDSELKIESRWECGDLGRSISFMLMDDLGAMFFRGTMTISKSAFMLQKEHYLELDEKTKPSLIFKVLKDKKFMGMPPSLEVHNSQFLVKLKAGDGFGFSNWTLNNIALENIESTIQDNVAMYDASIDGFSSVADVNNFLKIAYRSYEAS